nr:unnamed protein product [Digitaria exilis]
MSHQLQGYEGEVGSMTRLLPDDVLADVLRRAAPRVVATARRVCSAWRALVDERRLLRRDLVPRSLAGFFIKYNELPLPELFHRPSTNLITGHHRMPKSRVHDHCNGVLLLFQGLLNPAAGWWAPLPKLQPPPRVGPEAERSRFYQDMYLVFDPAVSPHCEVFLIPRVPRRRDDYEIRKGRCVADSAALLEMEWPPSPLTLNVFSTLTGRWGERSFSRGECEAAPGTIADMQKDHPYDHRHAVYWRGALYVHCEKDFVMR